MSDSILKVKVRDRNKILFDGESTGLTSRNARGTFDVLQNHANFISLIEGMLYIHRKEAPDVEIPVNNAIIKVKENTVEIYIGVK